MSEQLPASTGQTPAAGEKHTPGEWVIGENGVSVYALDIAPGKFHKGQPVMSNRMHCTLQEYHVLASREETKANARLIAAAPDLLEAAKGILDYLDTTDGECPPGCDCWHDLLRAAIAKAENGGQS